MLPSHIATDKIPVEFCHSSGRGGGGGGGGGV